MEVKAEKINPYDNERSKTQQVKEMFDSIAPAYDFMNRMMTFGIDKLWRARAVKMLRRHSPRLILDVATGT
ncbi:class I SAM-dependent methyltransferase, partial [uncultured Muribaculum sp.]